VHEAFENFSHAVFADGALPERTRELIAVAVAPSRGAPTAATGTPGGLAARGPARRRSLEAIWVAAEMRAVGAYGHATLALRAMGAGSSDETTP
jgi:alkylhydroperoxidase/carboxymuconolactone decarboxylase family protein YurZ